MYTLSKSVSLRLIHPPNLAHHHTAQLIHDVITAIALGLVLVLLGSASPSVPRILGQAACATNNYTCAVTGTSTIVTLSLASWQIRLLFRPRANPDC